MLKRIKLIQGIGNFQKTVAGGIEIGDVTVIYGENRNGKSTFCDVMHSLQADDPSFILDRKTIPSDHTKPPKVELHFETGNGSVIPRFEDEQWQVKIPECSKLYVFDHSFIHRNVMTGQKPERQNSENVTSFILGEANTALYRQLADLNTQLRQERANLATLGEQLKTHGVNNYLEYANSALPQKTKEQFKTEAASYKQREQQIAATIQNANLIRGRQLLGAVGQQVNYEPNTQAINSILAAGLQSVHQSSLATLNEHVTNHVNNAQAFKGWAGQGLGFIKGESCPFCGQGLAEDARGIITSYQQVFNAEFEQFNSSTRQTLNNLRQPFPIPNTHELLEQQHQRNKDILAIYSEPSIANEPSMPELFASLEQRFQGLINALDVLNSHAEAALQFWTPRLEQKHLIPYDPAQQVDFSALLQSATNYNQAISNYWHVVEQVNALLNQFKASLEAPQLTIDMAQMTMNYDTTLQLIKRIDLEPICSQYKQKQQEVVGLEVSYAQQKEQLDQSQSDYLDRYFRLINELFVQLGTENFEIIKVPNNRGKQVLFDLRVKFKGEDIPVDKINTVFSESDRRALALCIFLSKVLSLSQENRAKAILVLDDPVTSFDNERISLILNKFDELQRGIKQLIITTHYKGMAAKTVKKFKNVVGSIIIKDNASGYTLESVDNDKMMASAHDIAFDKIKSFSNSETNDDIVRDLRPFLEEEIRHRFKKQLIELGVIKDDLSGWITALERNNYISSLLANRLHAIRNTLNNPMHEIGDDPIDNNRSLARQILDVTYNELTPSV